MEPFTLAKTSQLDSVILIVPSSEQKKFQSTDGEMCFFIQLLTLACGSFSFLFFPRQHNIFVLKKISLFIAW